MEEIAKLFATWTPGTYGIYLGCAMIGVYMFREWRETRKLSLEDREARREGYAKQVESLQDENRDLRADMAALRSEYDKYRQLCHKETDDLRASIIRLEDEISGLRRRVDTQAIGAAKSSALSPAVEAAAGRVEKIVREREK